MRKAWIYEQTKYVRKYIIQYASYSARRLTNNMAEGRGGGERDAQSLSVGVPIVVERLTTIGNVVSTKNYDFVFVWTIVHIPFYNSTRDKKAVRILFVRPSTVVTI